MRKRIFEIIEPAQGNDKASIAYDILMLLAIAVSIIPLMFAEDRIVFHYIELITVILFIIDYILRWITADYELKKGWVSFVIYPFTFMAIIDMLSILPTIHLLSPTFEAARITRLLRILRVVKFIRYYEPLEIIMAVIRRQGRILWTVFSLAAFYIFITSR